MKYESSSCIPSSLIVLFTFINVFWLHFECYYGLNLTITCSWLFVRIGSTSMLLDGTFFFEIDIAYLLLQKWRGLEQVGSVIIMKIITAFLGYRSKHSKPLLSILFLLVLYYSKSEHAKASEKNVIDFCVFLLKA